LRVLILTEDTYGPKFLKGIITRLKNNNKVPQGTTVVYTKMPADCNSKMERILTVRARSVDRIVILVDSDRWGSTEKAHKRAASHIPESLKKRTIIIPLRNCIEDWVCTGLKCGSNVKEPVKLLKKRFQKGYEKHQLPDFANMLDLDVLEAKEDSFRKFLSSLMG